MIVQHVEHEVYSSLLDTEYPTYIRDPSTWHKLYTTIIVLVQVNCRQSYLLGFATPYAPCTLYLPSHHGISGELPKNR